MISQEIKVQKGDINNKSIPNTYVPGRNLVFLSLAAGLCESVNAEKIFVGFNQLDYTGYPDCRQEFIDAFESAINKGIAMTVDKKKGIKIDAPLISMSKSKIIRKGIEQGIDIESTWSCYEGGDRPCMRCDACLLRQKGLEEVNKKG